MSLNGRVMALNAPVGEACATTIYRDGQLIGGNYSGYSPCLSLAGTYLIQREPPQEVAVYELGKAECVSRLSFNAHGYVGVCSVADNGRWAAWVHDPPLPPQRLKQAEIRVYSASGDQIFRRILRASKPYRYPVGRAILSPSGDRLYLGTQTGEIFRFDLD